MAAKILFEPFELAGELHVPENPSRRIPGRLSYTAERSVLHLDEAFLPQSGDISVVDESPRYPVIHGVTTSGEAITLLNAQRIGIDINFGSGGLRQPERVLSPWLIVGAHVPADHVYPRVSFRIPGLEAWLAIPNIDHTIQHQTNDYRQTFAFGRKPALVAQVPAIDASIEFGTEYKSSVNPYKSISVEVASWVTFRSPSLQRLDWYLEQYGKLATMLAFLAGVPMPADCIEAAVDKSSHRVPLLVPLKQTTPCTYENPHDFFMSQPSMGKSLDEVIAKWYAHIPPVYIPSQLALGVLSSDNLWLHVEFLSLIQALEGFHRSRFPGEYTTESEHEKIKHALTAAIPPYVHADHRDSLRSRIRYGNQISLRKRLDGLTDTLTPELAKAILGKSGQVPRSWIDTRNYHTHWDEELRANVLEGQEMYFANVRMRHFLRALYIDLMGIPAEATAKCLLNTSRTSQQLLQLNLMDHDREFPSEKTGVIMTISEGSLSAMEPKAPVTMSPRADRGSQNPMERPGPTSWLLVAIAWTLVGIPLGWGIYITLDKALVLFR